MAEATVRISLGDKMSNGCQDNGTSNGDQEDKIFKWDIFEDKSSDNLSSPDIKFWNKIHKVAKVVFGVFLFVAVLSSAVLHKSTVFLLLTNIAPPNTLMNSSLKTSNYRLHYHTNETYIAYIWALVLILVFPYMFTFLSSLWNLKFKKSDRSGKSDKSGKSDGSGKSDRSGKRDGSGKSDDSGKNDGSGKSDESGKSNGFQKSNGSEKSDESGKGDVSEKCLKLKPLLIILLLEGLHSVGISLFVFGLLPNFDPVAGMAFSLNIVAVPALMELMKFDCKVQISRRILSITGFATTISSMALWIYYIYWNEFSITNRRTGLLIVSVMAPILISVVWWENFIPKKRKYLETFETQDQDARNKIHSIVSMSKIILTIVMVSVLFGSGCKDGSKCLDVLYGFPFENVPTVNTSTNDSYKLSNELGRSAALDNGLLGPTTLALGTSDVSCSYYVPFYIAAVNILSGLICFRCCIAANQILITVPSFSLPLVLATPITLVFMIVLYTNQTLTLGDSCIAPFPTWEGGLDFDWSLIVASILGFTAIVSVTGHIWIHNKDRMQSHERMFLMPMYCGVFLDQSMILNRKRAYSDRVYSERHKDGKDEDEPNINTGVKLKKKLCATPKIYLCATMWHEKKHEMTQLLKSLFRLDIDQLYQWKKKTVNPENPDYYKFEAHIFFDDAFETKNGHRQVNEHVRQLIEVMNNEHRLSYRSAEDRKMDSTYKIDTPYGGRLVWFLPSRNKLIVHLKDKEKIRHRKRWSQVMYMYYLLSHKLRDRGAANSTFILALDGDVDFQPSALKLLVDIMKRNSTVGAACGRISPIGTGPMVWYQKFEYAVSHWLQKATEHTLGCVLCSPGCFSLFRASHLMAEGVLKRYTTPPTEARHYVQYDQGEDRWLCTLLLQRGFRVEYCAASDALTYVPEGFYEFYNQRRRWTPSTMANIIDLEDFKSVIKQNEDISMLYIAYQMLLMVSSILTPGTIFLMIIGAINMAYSSLSLYWVLVLNLIPVAIFIILCFLAKPGTQLAYAAVLSTVYSLVMMLVIVGLTKQAADNGFCSVTTVFLCFVAGVFVIAAFLHPQEFWCILHGVLYFLAIPSMSMLLMLYAIGNLHVVSWGTRETANPIAEQNSPTQQKREHAVKEWLGDMGIARDSEYMFSFGNLFRCLCCPDDKRDDRDIKIEALLERVDVLESSPASKDNGHMHDNRDGESSEQTEPTVQTDVSSREQEKDYKEDKLAHVFARDKSIKGKHMKLKENEKVFWEELIKSYLFPQNEDKANQKKTQLELTELRNKVCLFFILTNALFVTIVFSLQQVNLESGGSISKELPCANGSHGGSFEPISMAFTGVFGVLLFIQFVCMVFHRMSTFLQICSITDIGEKDLDDDEKITRYIEILLKKESSSKSDSKAVYNSEHETTDEESDDLEDIEANENANPLLKHIGPREQFKRTYRVLSETAQKCDGKSVQNIKEEFQKSFTEADEKTLKTLTEFVQDESFHRTLLRRENQTAKQRTMKTGTRHSASAAKHDLPIEKIRRKDIKIEMSNVSTL